VDEACTDLVADRGERARRGGVERVGRRDLRLALRDVVERGGVDDDVRPQRLELRARAGGVADVEIVVREADDPLGRERLDEIAAELAGAADDGDGGQNTPPMRLMVCSMSASSVIQSML
jgi:hypothetical protein